MKLNCSIDASAARATYSSKIGRTRNAHIVRPSTRQLSKHGERSATRAGRAQITWLCPLCPVGGHFIGSGRQTCHEQASLVALAVDVALVVLGGEVDGHRKIRLALQDLCRVRGGRDRVAHLGERGGEEGMMRVVRPCDPREGLGGFGVFLGAVAGAPKVAPEALRVVWVKAHRLLDPVDALLRPSQPG